MHFIGPLQMAVEIVNGTMEIRHYHSTQRICLKHGEVGHHFGINKAYLHAMPRKPFSSAWEASLCHMVQREMLRRAFRDEVPSCNKRTPRPVQKMYHAVASKAAGIFNGTWKRLTTEHCDPLAMKLARRFPPTVRWNIYRAAANSDRARQLIETFPVLGVEIYHPSQLAPISAHQQALAQMVEEGVKLREIAEAAGITMMTRKLLPQVTNMADARRIDEQFGHSPSTFHNFLPKTAIGQQRWLYGLGFVVEAKFQEWAAKHAPLKMPKDKLRDELIQIRDWFLATGSNHVCSFETAKERAEAWHRAEVIRRRAEQDARLARQNAEFAEARRALEAEQAKPFPPPFLPAGTVGDLFIAPITDQAGLEDEGLAMHHCVASYGGAVRCGMSYIYSVRDVTTGKRVATLELATEKRGAFPAEPLVSQLRGPCNAVVPQEIVNAVQRWRTAKWATRQADLMAQLQAARPDLFKNPEGLYA